MMSLWRSRWFNIAVFVKRSVWFNIAIFIGMSLWFNMTIIIAAAATAAGSAVGRD